MGSYRDELQAALARAEAAERRAAEAEQRATVAEQQLAMKLSVPTPTNTDAAEEMLLRATIRYVLRSLQGNDAVNKSFAIVVPIEDVRAAQQATGFERLLTLSPPGTPTGVELRIVPGQRSDLYAVFETTRGWGFSCLSGTVIGYPTRAEAETAARARVGSKG